MRRRPGDQPEEIEDRGRIGCRKIADPAEERRVPHLDGDEQDLVEREEDRDLDQHRPAARDRIDLLLLVELHHRLLQAHAVVLEPLLQLLHLRLQLLHLGHRGIGAVGEREEDRLHDDRHGEDGEAEIAEKLVEPVDQLEHRLGDEEEPAPVDQQLEVRDLAGPSRVGVERRSSSFAPAKSRVSCSAVPPAGTDDRIAQKIRLVGRLCAGRAFQKARLELRVAGRDERGRPVFVGDAEPAGMSSSPARSRRSRRASCT